MKKFSAISKQFIGQPKVRLGLCVVGVIIVMAIIAAIPPLSKNSIGGLKPPPAAKDINNTSLSPANGQSYMIQTAAAAGQGGPSSVQGSVFLAGLPSSQNSGASAQVVLPAAVPIHSPCGVCDGRGLMCPDIVGACAYRCLGPVDYACPLE
jgi:hypothetical protein